MNNTVDFHAHFLPEAVIEAARAGERWHGADLAVNEDGLPVIVTEGRTKVLGSPRYLESPEDRLARLDAVGLDLQVVSVAPVMYRYGVDLAHAAPAAREINDELASWSARWPNRYRAFGTVPLQDVDAAVAELERVMGELDFVGMSVGTHVDGENWDSARLQPVLAAAQELGATVFFHPMGQRVPESVRGAYHLVNTIGNPFETTLAVAFLIFGGVLDDLPDLKLLFAHGGGFCYANTGRFDHGFRVRDDASADVQRLPSDYLRALHFDCMTHDPRSLRHLVDVAGIDQIVLGTDYPADMGLADPVKWLEDATTISDEERNAILGGNASRLLRSAREITA